MSRAAIEQLLYLLDESFEGHGEHSLLANLASLRDDDWSSAAGEGGRTAFDIVRHVGECKYVYDSHAFGDGSMRWDKPGSTPTVELGTSRDDITAWLRDGQRRLRDSVAALDDDAELLRLRRSSWGQEYETRWLINVMVQHDLYHAGEINHLRAVRHGDDSWAWEQG